MDRLQSQLHRLYGLDPGFDPGLGSLIDADGRVRALVLSVARPAEWSVVSRVWQGVQADLALPAPVIAVSGRDAYQLWFALAEPVLVAEAHRFLTALQARYLSDIAPQRIALMPAADGRQHADRVPAPQPHDAVWSAFVAPDLAPVFAETPWLDLPPNLDGQAELLARFDCIGAADFRQALASLLPASAPAVVASGPAAGLTEAFTDPRHFLMAVMNDLQVDLALRVEAAKALLHGGDS